MALTISEFRTSLRETRSLIDKWEKTEGTIQCDACGIPLQESITGNRPMADGSQRCSDCYFDEIATEIDEHPIFMPRIRRG
jgi:hypothetical protein